MSPKELVLQSIKDLPEGVSWQELEERVHFLSAIEKACEEVRNGVVVRHEEIPGLLGQCLAG